MRERLRVQKISTEIMQFFQGQGCVLVSTIDEKGFVHNACKGIVEIKPEGRVYLFDLYRQRTHRNLLHNPWLSVTAFNEHKFIGYCLKGVARAVAADEIDAQLMKAWEERIASRVTQRLLKNIKEEKGHPRHPEVLLPSPKYLIEMEVQEVVDLTPQHLR